MFLLFEVSLSVLLFKCDLLITKTRNDALKLHSLFINLLVKFVCLLLCASCLLIRHIDCSQNIGLTTWKSYLDSGNACSRTYTLMLPKIPLLLFFGEHVVRLFGIGLDFFRC